MASDNLNAEARRLLNQVLRTDADFTAFVLDHFPATHQRFSLGMDRISRTSLLLEEVGAKLVQGKLKHWTQISHEGNAMSPKTEILFQHINSLYIKFRYVLCYDLVTNTAGEILPAVITERRVVDFRDNTRKFNDLVSSFAQALEECRTMCLKASYDELTDQDRIDIEAYLCRFSAFLEEINKDLIRISNLKLIGPTQIIIFGRINKHIERFYNLLSVIENDKKSIESSLRNYNKGKPVGQSSTEAKAIQSSNTSRTVTQKARIFISYCHSDKRFLDALLQCLKPLESAGLVTKYWSDKNIVPGARWMDEIQNALACAKVAVMMVSPAFLASKFITDHELGPLLERADKDGVRILWIPVRASVFDATPLSKYKAVIPPSKPLAAMKAEKRDKAWVIICDEINKAVNP